MRVALLAALFLAAEAALVDEQAEATPNLRSRQLGGDCPHGYSHGYYCGDYPNGGGVPPELNLDPETVYLCHDGEYYPKKDCADYGEVCYWKPAGVPDTCQPTPPSPTPPSPTPAPGCPDTFFDDFDPIDYLNWDKLDGAVPSDVCGAASGNKALVFKYESHGDREAKSKELTLTSSSVMSFKVKAGRDDGVGNACDDPEGDEEDLLLQFCDCDDNWHTVRRFDSEDPAYNNFEHIQIGADEFAFSTDCDGHVRFRFYQEDNSGSTADFWAVDDIVISRVDTLYFANSGQNTISKAPGDGSGPVEVIISNATGGDLYVPVLGFKFGPTGLDIDFENGQVYVNNGNRPRYTYVQPLDGSGTPTLVEGSGGPIGPGVPWAEHFALKLDLPNERYFFTTDTTDGLWVHNIDGTGTPFKIASSGSDNFHGVDYDPSTDQVYAGSVRDREIWRYKSDGADGTLLFNETDGVTGVRGITLDVPNGRIYWNQHIGGPQAPPSSEILLGPIEGRASGLPTVVYTSPEPFLVADLEFKCDLLYWTEFISVYWDQNQNPLGGSMVMSAAIGTDGSLGAPTLLYDLPNATHLRGIKVV